MEIQQLQSIIANNEAVMVYFSGENCGVCQALKPKVQTLFTQSFPKVTLVFIEADSFVQTAREFGVFTIPTLIIFVEQKEFIRQSRHISINQLEEQFSRTYNIFFEE